MRLEDKRCVVSLNRLRCRGEGVVCMNSRENVGRCWCKFIGRVGIFRIG